MVQIIIEIIVAVFAVLGFYSIFGMAADAIFCPDNSLIAIEIRDTNDIEDLDLLLQNAACGACRGKIVVIVDEAVFSEIAVRGGKYRLGENVDVLIEKYGVDFRLTSKIKNVENKTKLL